MNNSSASDGTVMSLYQTAAVMRNQGISDKEIRKRLKEIGLQDNAAAELIRTLPSFIQETHSMGRVVGPPKVFISHSHHDRETASRLQKILEQNQVRTFLDQHTIIAGQDLTSRLTLGLIWCDKFLLLWSRHSIQSDFVRWEWQTAYKLVKGIVPYILDDTPLPQELEGLVYVNRSDLRHGHANMLRAILGRQWKPDTMTLFPGLWHAELSLLGLGAAEYKLELRGNGQIIGHGQIKQSGLIAQFAQGFENILSIKIPLSGTWSYYDLEKCLELDITATLMNQTHRDVVRIFTTGKEKGWIRGQTLGGLPWRLRRIR